MKTFKLMAIGSTAMTIALAAPAAAGPLQEAARAGDGALMQQLLRDGADINEQDEAGETALFAAASGGWYSVHDQLLVAGADVSIRDNRGFTVLHAAASSGNANVIAGLIGEDHRSQQIDLDDHDNELGATPLAVAADANHGNIVAYLYAHGADPAVPNKAGLTALTIAGQKGYDDIITLLLRTGSLCQDIDPVWKAACDTRKAELGK
jgi:ankyrin repeat protein